jgi:hypothetical protein
MMSEYPTIKLTAAMKATISPGMVFSFLVFVKKWFRVRSILAHPPLCPGEGGGSHRDRENGVARCGPGR